MAVKKDPPQDDGEEEPLPRLIGTLADVEEAWGAFTQMSATGWRFLPYAGGLLDQPELLMGNIYRIASVIRQREEPADAKRA